MLPIQRERHSDDHLDAMDPQILVALYKNPQVAPIPPPRPFVPRGVIITKFGTKYHIDPDCRALQNSANVRRSPPCADCAFTMNMQFAYRGDTIWSLGQGRPYHRHVGRPPRCATGKEFQYEICSLCFNKLPDQNAA